MKITRLAASAAVRCVLLFTSLAPIAGAQNQTWIRQFGTSDGDFMSATASDGVGGVFVGGTTLGSFSGVTAGFNDAWFARYDGAGRRMWIRQIGTSRSDYLLAAAVNGTGGVHLVGYTAGDLGGSNLGREDIWLANYDAAGNQTWIRQFGTSESETASAAAADGMGGVFLCGTTLGDLGGPNSGGQDAWLAHYGGAGNQAWIRQLGSSSTDSATVAVADGLGGAFVGGTTYGALGGPNSGGSSTRDAWLAHYDGSGSQTWIRQLGSSDNESLLAAVPDGSGGVYLGGGTNGSLGGPNSGLYDAWLAHYDATGNQTWIRQFGSSEDDGAWVAAPDGSGGVYVGGDTVGNLAGPNAGLHDTWLAHYDNSGSQTWIRQFGTTDNEYGSGAASDGSGGVFLAGYMRGSPGGANPGWNVWLAHYDNLISTRYCTPAIANSTGQSGLLTATGSNRVAANNLTVTASQLPTNTFGFILTSLDQGSVFPVSNSQGRLCLVGLIGRYVGPGQVQNSGAVGSFTLGLDLTAMAQPQGAAVVQPGETWNFQAWHRDANPATTSNFTDAVAVTFH